MTLPATVKVGALVYTISDDAAEVNRMCREDRVDALGATNHRHLTILIEPDQAPGQLRDTLLHECLHALTRLAGLEDEWGCDDAEKIVARLTPILHAWLLDNPGLLAYIAEVPS